MEVLAEVCGLVLLLVCVFVPLSVLVLELVKRDRQGKHERARREADAARLAGHVSDEALRKYVEGS
jgi:hypothetical protein